VRSQSRKPNIFWAASKEAWQVEGGDSTAVLHSGLTQPGVLHPALEPSTQKSHRAVAVSPEEGHKNDQRIWSTSPVRKGWESWDC